MLDLHGMFEEGRGIRELLACGLACAGSWKIPLTPENLRVFFVSGLGPGIVGRSDFLPGGPFFADQ